MEETSETSRLSDEEEIRKLIQWHKNEIIRLGGSLTTDEIISPEYDLLSIESIPRQGLTTQYVTNRNSLTPNDIIEMRRMMETSNIPGPYRIQISEGQYDHLRAELMARENRDVDWSIRNNPNNQRTLHGVQIHVQEETTSESDPWPRAERELRQQTTRTYNARNRTDEEFRYQERAQGISPGPQSGSERRMREALNDARRRNDLRYGRTE